MKMGLPSRAMVLVRAEVGSRVLGARAYASGPRVPKDLVVCHVFAPCPLTPFLFVVPLPLLPCRPFGWPQPARTYSVLKLTSA